MREDLNVHSPCGQLLGTSILHADSTEKTLEVAYEAKQEFTNRIGTIAGAMIAAMMDSATGLAVLAILPDGLTAVHTSLEIEYLRPAHPGRLVGRARVVEQQDRDIRSEGQLFDSEGQIVARGRARLRVIRKGRS